MTDPSRLIPYGRATLRVLGETQGLAIGEMEVPAASFSPPPAFHNGFDEAIFVVSGQLSVVRGHDHARTVEAGELFMIPRAPGMPSPTRAASPHTFSACGARAAHCGT